MSLQSVIQSPQQQVFTGTMITNLRPFSSVTQPDQKVVMHEKIKKRDNNSTSSNIDQVIKRMQNDRLNKAQMDGVKDRIVVGPGVLVPPNLEK